MALDCDFYRVTEDVQIAFDRIPVIADLIFDRIPVIAVIVDLHRAQLLNSTQRTFYKMAGKGRSRPRPAVLLQMSLICRKFPQLNP